MLPIPDEATEQFRCSPAWLSKALNVDVEDLKFELLSGGYSGCAVSRVAIRMAAQKDRIDEATGAIINASTDASSTGYTPSLDSPFPKNIIVKFFSAEHQSPRNWMERLGQTYMPIETICKKEAFFYRTLLPMMRAKQVFETPRCYFIGINDAEERNGFLVLFGDARSRFKMVIGMDELSLNGAPTVSYPVGFLLREEAAALAIARVLARNHAAFFGQPSMLTDTPNFAHSVSMEVTWIGNFFASIGLKEGALQEIFEGWKTADIPFLKNDDQEMKKKLLGLSDYYAKVEPFIMEGEREKRGLFKYRTFVHGDCHLGNMAIPCDLEHFNAGHFDRVLFVDWQMYGDGWGCAELQYFMNLSIGFSPDLYESMMREYYAALVPCLSEEHRQGYPYDIFLKESVAFAVYSGAGLLLFMKMIGTYEEFLLKKEKDNRWRDFAKFLVPMICNSFARMAYIIEKYANLFDDKTEI